MSNRDKKLEPNKGRGWCRSCDMALVSDGQKCPCCGHVNNRRRNKKPGPPPDPPEGTPNVTIDGWP